MVIVVVEEMVMAIFVVNVVVIGRFRCGAWSIS
jgi:hypothetical protein